MSSIEFLKTLEATIDERVISPKDGSYTSSLAEEGIMKVSKKLGEEAVEVALAAVAESTERLTEESADLIYHLLVVLRLRGLKLENIISELEKRHNKQSN
ncbi:MAG: phosphoribosyl-ATP diphosphatase [Gammaproteobacteria bacterium]|nr:phosphoribosyl-ATP diphosphatase [Gammaproteobacteria bacterium]